MASIFPSDPITGEKFTVGTTTYQWTGNAWIKISESTQLVNLTLQSLTATTSILVSAVTNSTSTNTGAVVVRGGVGVGEDVWIGGAVYIANTSTIAGSEIITTATLVKYVQPPIFVAGTDTAITTSTSNFVETVTIWNTSTLESVTDRGNSTTHPIDILNGTNSTSTDSGALIVQGGVGIGEDVWIGGAVYIANTSTIAGSEIITTATLVKYVQQPVFVAGTDTAITTSTSDFVETVTIWNTSTLQSVTDRGHTTTNQVTILNATSSTAVGTGALYVEGGISAGGDLWLGGTIYCAGVPIVTTSTLIDSIASGEDIKVTVTPGATTGSVSLIISNTSTLQTVTTRGSSTNHIVYFDNTTESTSSSTGAVVVKGGLGVGGRINAESVQIADAIMDSSLIYINNTDTTVVDIYPTGLYRSAKYLIQIDDGAGPEASFETIEILLLVDNQQNVYATEYAVLSSNGELGEFAADVQNDDMLRLYFTAFQASDKVLTIFRTGLTV
jgi:hypothetical protein